LVAKTIPFGAYHVAVSSPKKRKSGRTKQARGTASSNAARPEKNFITALARGLSVMRAFSGQPDRLTLVEISKIVELPRATVRRCLITLNTIGYIETNGKYFRLTPQVLTLSQAYFSSNPLPRIAQLHIEEVSETVKEFCSVSVLSANETVFVARSSRKRHAFLHREVGLNLPAYCTSTGRVMLAALPPPEFDRYFAQVELKKFTHKTVTDQKTLRGILAQIRKDDFCLVDGELEPDLRAIAIPIRNSAGAVIAAMNVSTGTDRMTAKKLQTQVLPIMRQAASKIRNAMPG